MYLKLLECSAERVSHYFDKSMFVTSLTCSLRLLGILGLAWGFIHAAAKLGRVKISVQSCNSVIRGNSEKRS